MKDDVGTRVALVIVVSAVFGAGVAKAKVDDPIMSPSVARERSVLFLVTAGPEMESVVRSMEIAVLSRGMKVSFAAVRAPDGPSLVPAPEVARTKVVFPAVRVADGLR